jgi:plastocyanin
VRTGRTITTAAVIALGLVGCGDDTAQETDDTAQETDDTATEEPTGETDGTDGAEGGGAAAGEGPTVEVSDIAFQQGTVTAPAGTAVTWDNQDSVGHTVTSGTPDDATGEFDEELPAGEQVSITVEEPGTYAYFCRIHPQMTAELVVEPAEG